jgi:5-(carboxyamino)imidazole ribonucleotide synthase
MRRDCTPLKAGAVIGIVGGGQLGRMLAMSALQHGFHTHVYSCDAGTPAEEVATYTTVADYTDEAALQRFADAVDAVTVEFENIPEACAVFLSEHVAFYPSPTLFAVCQHRVKEKEFIASCGVATAAYASADSLASLQEAVEHIGVPCIAKHTTHGYDGKGQRWIRSYSECADAWLELKGKPLIVEAVVPFACEASVLIGRTKAGQIELFPIARNDHSGGILKQSSVPSGISDIANARMEAIARGIAECADLVGLLAIECFILQDDSVLVNEMAARPHNSGHWTMNGCTISQFDMVIRICAGLPLTAPKLLFPTTMINLIGEEARDADAWLHDAYATVHLYGKEGYRAGRKMGHVNVIHPSLKIM